MTNYQISQIGIPFPPMGAHLVPNIAVAQPVRGNVEPPPLALPGSNLPRALNYYADYGGCGLWRMIWPELLLNTYQKAIINGLTTMVLDPRFYEQLKAVRIQRQATPVQKNFTQMLKQLGSNHGFKVIYEIDDIILKDDIPDFNRCKVAFEDPQIVSSIKDIMGMCDEVSVTCDYMRDYYIDKIGNKNITVIPNYPPRSWADGFYNPERLRQNFTKNKKRPRIGYCGSGTHIDVTNKTNQQDDFAHIVDFIIKTRKQYKWVMMGCFPLPIKPFIDCGDIEYADWAPIMSYPRAMYNLNLNATIAPLQDCHFNRAKSEIKFLEAACQGLPGVYQDMVTYANAPLRFKTGSELIDQLNHLLKDENTYMKYSKKSREYAETMWLDDHLDEFSELYFTPYGSKERKALTKRNP